MSRPVLTVAACVLALQVATLSAQQQPPPPPQQAPVFRAGTVLVPLSVSVVDLQGNPVTGLTQDNFIVREAGAPQDIRIFQPLTLTPQPPPPMAGSTLIRAPRSDPSKLTPPTRRTFLLVLGFSRLQVPTKALDGAIQFIREKLLPQDLVAVLAFDRATDFTTDHEAVARMVERFKKRHEAVIREVTDYYDGPFHRGMDLSPSIRAHIDEVFAPGTMRSARTMLSVTGVFDKDDVLPGIKAAPTAAAVTRNDVLKLYAGIEYLRYVDGDKHLVWMADGDPGNGDLDTNRSVARRAADARVVVDVLHTGGISLPIDMSRPGRRPPTAPAASWSINDAEQLTEATGGQFTGVSYADEFLARVDRATRYGYLLGYAPSNAADDGRYRKVTVTVNRPDVVVLFRHGYAPREDPPPEEIQEKMTTARLDAAGLSSGVSEDIAITARASIVAGIGINRRVFVELTIDASRLSFTAKDGRRVGRLDIQVNCGDAEQRAVGEQRETLDLAVDEKAYQRMLKDGIPFRVRVPITGEPTYVKAVVYDYGADLLGAAIIKIK